MTIEGSRTMRNRPYPVLKCSRGGYLQPREPRENSKPSAVDHSRRSLVKLSLREADAENDIRTDDAQSTLALAGWRCRHSDHSAGRRLMRHVDYSLPGKHSELSLARGDVSDFMSIPCKPQGEMKENAMDKLQTFELFTACYFLGLDLDSDMKWKMVRIELRVTRPGYLHSIAPAISRVNHLGTAEAADRSASTSKSASPPQRRQFPLLRK